MKAERKIALLRRVPDVIGAATTRPWCVPHMTRELTGGGHAVWRNVVPRSAGWGSRRS